MPQIFLLPYFSNGYYGVGAAARGYFDKEVSELTVAEQVFIAAIPNNPTRYNPNCSLKPRAAVPEPPAYQAQCNSSWN